jgi:microcystin-dependent protein
MSQAVGSASDVYFERCGKWVQTNKSKTMSLFQSLEQLWSRDSNSSKSNSRGHKRTRHGKRGLRFEALEDRSMMAVTDSAGGNQPHENMQSYIALNYVIATEGIFPSQNLGAEQLIGAVEMFAGTFAPVGYAFCDGSLLPIAQYTALFTIIGTTYGGDGQTTFALPDLRGRVPVGAGQGTGLSNYALGQVSGVEMVTLSSSNLANHTHTVTGSATPTEATGGSQPFENRQPTLALTPVIALQGIFPSRNLSREDMLGSVHWFAGNFAPRGYAIAAGQLLPINQNTALFSLLGTMYGGNGQTTFALPDLRGRMAVGIGGGSSVLQGEKGGTENVTPTVGNLPSHVHTISGSVDPTGATGGSQPFDNRQPFLGLNYQISLEGIYPSRPLTAGDSGTEEPIGQGFNSGDVTLDEATARPLIDSLTQEAIRRWQAAGISDVQVAALQSTSVVIGDLPSGSLASAGESVITLDRDASNRGWYIDVTPGDELEFGSIDPRTGELVATDPTAARHYDLLTALMHEQGHILGLNHASLPGRIMYGGLGVGERTLPAAADLIADGSTPEAEQFLQADPFIAAVSMFAGNFDVRGWSSTSGQLLSIAQNTALFSLLGTMYGGNGQTTFALPNTQGRAIIGAGSRPGLSSYDLGQTGGQDFVTLSVAEIPAHTHTLPAVTAAAPTVTSPTAASVTANSATLGGTVTTDNGAAITERGILVSKTNINSNPQLNGGGVTKITATGTTGVFTVAATGLDLATGYSYVAFATNSVGTTYTTVDTFTTLAAAPTVTSPTKANITSTSATLGGTVTTDNGAAITERGILVSKTNINSNPQLNGGGVTKITATGTTGVFTVAASGLDLATGYSYVAFATNSVGTTYTTVDTFTTTTAAPTLGTPNYANVTATTANLFGFVDDTGGTFLLEAGFVYAKTADDATPQIGEANVIKLLATSTPSTSPISFSYFVQALQPATQYTFATYAINSVGTSYSVYIDFTTPAAAPTVTLPTASNLGLTTATLGGTVTVDGGSTITERGIVYSITTLNGNPQIGGVAVLQATAAGTTGTFTIDVSALPTGTQISYAAYAKNAIGTSYSAVSTFTTQPPIGQFPGITVQVLGGVMIVTGSSQDDTIKVASDGSGGLIVTSNQLINGQASPRTFAGATSFVANMLGGHDDLWLAAPLTFNSVTVDLGVGNDRAVLGADPNNSINNNVLDPQFGTLGYLTVNGPLQVTGGEGNDRVIERSTEINGVKTINLGEGNNEYNVYWGFSNETNFSSGAGVDYVYIGYLSSRQASQFNTGAGNDLISYYASRFYKTAYLNSGAGIDTVALDVNIYDDATTVDTGSDADYLLFSRSVAYSSIALTTGGGADYVLIGKYIAGLNSSGGAIYSNGGSNVVLLTLNTSDGADTVQIAANVIRDFFANLGDSYDDADVDYNVFTDGLLDGGPQGTRLRSRGNANLRTKNIAG